MIEEGVIKDNCLSSRYHEMLYTYRHKSGIELYTNFDMSYAPKRTGHWGAYSTIGYWRPDWSSGTTDIFYNNVGIPPGYMGNVPGAKFRFGARFYALSVDAKRFVRGEEKY